MRSAPLMMTLSLLLLAGCEKDSSSGDTGPSGGDDTAAGDDTGSDGGEVYFTEGQYRFDTLTIETDTEDAADLNGDGEPDNKLPSILSSASLLSSDLQVSPDELNSMLSEALSDESLVMLVDALQVSGSLSLDVLLGDYDADADALTVNPDSYDGDTPKSRMTGGAVAEDGSYLVGADYIEIPFLFVVTEPAVFIPLALASSEGQLAATGADGVLTGAVPVQGMIDQVIDPLIPTEEEGYDPADYLNMERDELLESIKALGDAGADVELEDGSLAFSAVIRWSGTTASF